MSDVPSTDSDSNPVLCWPRSEQARRNIDTICIGLSAIAMGGVLGMLVGHGPGGSDLRNGLLAIGSTAFVLVGFVGGGLGTTFGRCVLAGHVLCWLGDVFGPHHFLLGVYFFFGAHFGFMAAFVVHGLERRRLGRAVLAVLLVSVVLLAWLVPTIPAHERASIYAYMAVLSLMLVLAGGTRPDRRGILLQVAAVLFFASDVCLARSKYVEYEFVNTLIGYPMYYASCTMFAWSVRPALGHPRQAGG